MKRYSLITIDSTEHSVYNLSFEEIKENAYFHEQYDTVNAVLRDIIKGLNQDFFSDQNYYAVVDNIEQEILYI